MAAHREFLFHHQRSEFAADAAVEGAGRDLRIGVRRQDRFKLAVYGIQRHGLTAAKRSQLGFNPAVDSGKFQVAGRAADLRLAVDRGRLDVAGDILNHDVSIDAGDVLQARVLRNLDCVIHNAIVSFAVFEPEPAPREAGHARRLLRVDEDLVRSRINNDLGGFNAFPGLAVFEGFDGHFVAVPAGDFNPAVDIVEAEPAIGGEREGLAEILLKLILRQKVADDFCFLDMGFTQRSGSHRLRRHCRAGRCWRHWRRWCHRRRWRCWCHDIMHFRGREIQ